MKSIENDAWRAQADAYTLAKYNEIMSDPKRKKAAINAAAAQAADLENRLRSYKSIANKKK